MTGFTLTIIGPPVGKARPRVVRHPGQPVRAITPVKTILAEQEVRRAWEQAGEPRLPDGPVVLRMLLVVERPGGHYKRTGGLSAEGLRHPLPDRKKPDVDNALKLVMDSLNGRAWTDDVRVVHAEVRRVWGDQAKTVVDVAVADGEWLVQAA